MVTVYSCINSRRTGTENLHENLVCTQPNKLSFAPSQQKASPCFFSHHNVIMLGEHQCSLSLSPLACILSMCVFTPSFAQLLAAKTRERTNIAVWHRVMLFAVCARSDTHTQLGDDLLICFIIWACTWQNSIIIAAGRATASKDKTNTSNTGLRLFTSWKCTNPCARASKIYKAVGNQIFNFERATTA